MQQPKNLYIVKTQNKTKEIEYMVKIIELMITRMMIQMILIVQVVSDLILEKFFVRVVKYMDAKLVTSIYATKYTSITWILKIEIIKNKMVGISWQFKKKK